MLNFTAMTAQCTCIKACVTPLACTEKSASPFRWWECCILLSSCSCFCPGQVSKLNATKKWAKQKGLRSSLWDPKKDNWRKKRKIAKQWFVCIGMAESALSQVSHPRGQKKNSLKHLRRDALESTKWKRTKSYVALRLTIKGRFWRSFVSAYIFETYRFSFRQRWRSWHHHQSMPHLLIWAPKLLLNVQKIICDFYV